MSKLNHDDSRAVDLYLEARAHADGRNPSPPGPQTARVSQRLKAVSALMDVLAELPAAEPPSGLLARTLAAVDARRGEKKPVVPSERAASTTRIHA